MLSRRTTASAGPQATRPCQARPLPVSSAPYGSNWSSRAPCVTSTRGTGSSWRDTMAKVFITGSADGLGLMAGELLASQGHTCVLHARTEVRAQRARTALPSAVAAVVGDLSTIAAMRSVADQA